jgi:hypothetical protein
MICYSVRAARASGVFAESIYIDQKTAFLRIEGAKMSSSDLNRRDFHRLSMAAMGGLMAGVAAGCQNEQPAAKSAVTEKTNDATDAKAESPKSDNPQVAESKSEKHTCRGLNTCKGLGGGAAAGKNACAGQGECATVAEHSCGDMNECKGQGGCGKNPGENECKGKGGCHVPLMEFAWEKIRKRFEEKMTADGKKFGKAPPAKKSA